MLKPGVPGWLGNLAEFGHPGTYNQVDGGPYGELAPKWLKWVLFGDTASAQYFKEDKMAADGWTELMKKDLTKIPIGA